MLQLRVAAGHIVAAAAAAAAAVYHLTWMQVLRPMTAASSGSTRFERYCTVLYITVAATTADIYADIYDHRYRHMMGPEASCLDTTA